MLRYLNRLSGPFLDRIDIQIEVARLPRGTWADDTQLNETSDVVQQRVEACRQRQISRQGSANAHLGTSDLKNHCYLTAGDNEFLELAVEKLGLSTRAHHKILKIARTLADMVNSEHILHEHLIEALSYRAMDRLLRHLTSSVTV